MTSAPKFQQIILNWYLDFNSSGGVKVRYFYIDRYKTKICALKFGQRCGLKAFGKRTEGICNELIILSINYNIDLSKFEINYLTLVN